MAEEILRTEGLCKRFGALEVLRGITVSIHRQEIVSVIGPSGGGKSTFLRCLNLLEIPTEGEIWFDGVLIRKDGRFVLPELEGLNPENLK